MPTEQEEENIETVRRYIAAFNTGDVANVEEFVSPEYFNRESQASPERANMRGPDEVRDTIKNLRSAFAELHYEEQGAFASGDRVAMVLQVSGRHVGNFFGIEPTGRSFSYAAVHIHRLAGGKIVEHRAVRDDLRFMMQLEVIKPAEKYELIFQAWKNATAGSAS
jgi:steroid delta-isomerase-like uncharacterized protein